jgi:hypothetical protein
MRMLLLVLQLQLCNSPNILQQLVCRDRTLSETDRARKPHFARHLGLLERCAPPADDVDAPGHKLRVCLGKV